MSKQLDIRILLSTCLLGSLMTACGAASDGEVDFGNEEANGVAVQALSTDQPATSLKPTKELARDWMRWEMKLPYTTGPVADMTGEQCAMGQEGPVWLLAGTYGGSVTRECTIPAGKTLFFPLKNTWWVIFGENFLTPSDVNAYKNDVIRPAFNETIGDTCALTLRIDGEEVAGGFEEMREDLYIQVPDVFKGHLNEDNFLTQYGYEGISDVWVVGDGHYARIKPLSPGDHVLELGGSSCDDNGSVRFQTAVTYHLHIEE